MYLADLKHRLFHKLKKLFLNNKGSMIPESAMVIPLIILITASSVTLMMDLYQMVLTETKNDRLVFEDGFSEAESIRRASVIGDLFNEEE